MKLSNTLNDISKENRIKICEILQSRLVDILDLQSQAKQAHWNVKGPNFKMLHELFDETSAMLLEHGDLVAERIKQLGGQANGTSRTVAKTSMLEEYPLDIINGQEHVLALSKAVAALAKPIREAIDQTDQLQDKDAADIFTGISRDLDKQLWFIESHLG